MSEYFLGKASSDDAVSPIVVCVDRSSVDLEEDLVAPVQVISAMLVRARPAKVEIRGRPGVVDQFLKGRAEDDMLSIAPSTPSTPSETNSVGTPCEVARSRAPALQASEAPMTIGATRNPQPATPSPGRPHLGPDDREAFRAGDGEERTISHNG